MLLMDKEIKVNIDTGLNIDAQEHTFLGIVASGQARACGRWQRKPERIWLTLPELSKPFPMWTSSPKLCPSTVLCLGLILKLNSKFHEGRPCSPQ